MQAMKTVALQRAGPHRAPLSQGRPRLSDPYERALSSRGNVVFGPALSSEISARLRISISRESIERNVREYYHVTSPCTLSRYIQRLLRSDIEFRDIIIPVWDKIPSSINLPAQLAISYFHFYKVNYFTNGYYPVIWISMPVALYGHISHYYLRNEKLHVIFS